MANKTNDIETTKAHLELMGVKYAQNATDEEITKIFTEHMAKDLKPAETALDDATANAIAQTQEALRVFACKIICHNPNKAEMFGQYIMYGNAHMQSKKHFVPFNCDEANEYPLTRMAIDLLKMKVYQKITKKGDAFSSTSSVTPSPEFTIIELYEIIDGERA